MATGVVLNIRVPEEAYDEIAALAKLEQRSIPAMDRQLIEEAIEARQQSGGGSRRGGGVQTGKEERVESAFERLMGRPDKAPQS